MNKKRQLGLSRWQVIPTNNTSPYAIQNPHYVFRPRVQEPIVDDTDMDLTQARAVLDYIRGLQQ
jgi:hypothetical protein